MNIKKLLSDQVIVDPEPIQEVKTASGIILDKDPEMDGTSIGVVAAVGIGKVVAGVGLVKVDLEVGDKIMFRYGKPVVIECKTYALVMEADCILII